MKFLAFDTAGKSTRVVAVNGAKQAFFCDSDGRRASEVLLPNADRLLVEVGLTLDALDFIGVVIGPGSFTGIRIAVSSARSLCYALQKPAVCVTFCASIAYNERAADKESILTVTDASNGNAYVAAYDAHFNTLLAPSCLNIAQAVDFVRLVDEPMALMCDEITDSVLRQAGFDPIAPDENCASLIASMKANAHHAVSYSQIEPLYIRVSQAEKELAEKIAASERTMDFMVTAKNEVQP